MRVHAVVQGVGLAARIRREGRGRPARYRLSMWLAILGTASATCTLPGTVVAEDGQQILRSPVVHWFSPFPGAAPTVIAEDGDGRLIGLQLEVLPRTGALTPWRLTLDAAAAEMSLSSDLEPERVFVWTVDPESPSVRLPRARVQPVAISARWGGGIRHAVALKLTRSAPGAVEVHHAASRRELRTEPEVLWFASDPYLGTDSCRGDTWTWTAAPRWVRVRPVFSGRVGRFGRSVLVSPP